MCICLRPDTRNQQNIDDNSFIQFFLVTEIGDDDENCNKKTFQIRMLQKNYEEFSVEKFSSGGKQQETFYYY